MDATTRFTTERVGALPMMAAYLEKLGISDIVNEHVSWEGGIDLGTLVSVMMCNRLLNTKPQYKIGEWAGSAGVCRYFQVSAESLNDDLLGRALDRVATHAHTIQSQLVLRMIKVFKLDVSKIHYDISTAELYGAYERQLKKWNDENDSDSGPAGPKPAYGRTKSGRKNMKQVQFGINVAGDGAVPLYLIPFDGNQAEVKTHLENLDRLREVLPTTNLVYTADTKFDAPENILLNKARGGRFLCGGVFQPNVKDEYLDVLPEMKLVDYSPKSKQALPPDKRPKYKVHEVYKRMEGRVDGREVKVRYRLLYVWSEAKAEQEAKTRVRHHDKVVAEFTKIKKNLNKYSLTSREKIVQRLEAARNKYINTVGSAFKYELTERKGTFQLQWYVDETEMKRSIDLEGAYIIKTDLAKLQYPTAKVLEEYKQQIQVERRIGDMKGPLAIAPMYLEKPERIAGLMQVLLWCLMAMSLMERDVRKSLKGKPIYGLYPENRPCPAPTGRGILECFEDLCVVVIKHKGETSRRLGELSDIQRRLIELMGIPPNSLRAFKRRQAMG